MQDQQITTFNVNINLIDEIGGTDANKVVDSLVEKIQEVKGYKVQIIGATLNIKMPSSTAQRHLLDIKSDESGKLNIEEVPKEAQAPPQV